MSDQGSARTSSRYLNGPLRRGPAVQSVRIREARWSGPTAALRFYLRAMERYGSARSLWSGGFGTYGTHVQGGTCSTDTDLVEAGQIGACLPSVRDSNGSEVQEAVVARGLLLVTCGGDGSEGCSLSRAAREVRARFGPEYTDSRCRRLLRMASGVFYGALQAEGLIGRAWRRR